MAEHCGDNSADRKLGKYWEEQFCLMAAGQNKSFTPMQIGRVDSAVALSQVGERWNTYTLPDVTIWTAPGEHHEIKHKNPTSRGTFGLEVYRFNALFWFAKETQQDVLYTIHNHDLAGGREARINNIDHWLTANVLDLNNNLVYPVNGDSYVNGRRAKDVSTYFWPKRLWQPLTAYWGIPVMKQMEITFA